MTRAERSTCAWCDGTGNVTSERNFLLARLRAGRDYRWIGVSSDALVTAAMTGKPPTTRPFDGWDLGRCLVTQAVAPADLAVAMGPIIDGWIKRLERDKPYYGIGNAREMLAEHVDAVRRDYFQRQEDDDARDHATERERRVI